LYKYACGYAYVWARRTADSKIRRKVVTRKSRKINEKIVEIKMLNKEQLKCSD